MNTLRQFKVGEITYAFAKGNGCYLVCADDLIHWVTPCGEAIELFHSLEWSEPNENGMRRMIGENYEKLTLDEIESRLEGGKPMNEFVSYWGIKDRIQGNYSLLVSSLREIGCDPSGLPKWGAK